MRPFWTSFVRNHRRRSDACRRCCGPTCSLRRLRHALAISRGFRVSVKVVTQLLGKLPAGTTQGFEKAVAETSPATGIASSRSSRISTANSTKRCGNPIFSIDTKKKELIGDLFREGHTYTQKVVETLDHDFPSPGQRRTAYPHGLYDLQRNHGPSSTSVPVTINRCASACDSLAYWWAHFGRLNYPHATSLLLLCDRRRE